MSKIMIIADLGQFKAYKITKDPLEINPRINLIASYNSIEGHGKLGDKVSDAAGRFRKGGQKEAAAKGSGERHNIELEKEKRLIKMMASDINNVIVDEKCKKWYLASGQQINGRILKNLKPEVKAALDKNITANLTRTDKSELLSRFL